MNRRVGARVKQTATGREGVVIEYVAPHVKIRWDQPSSVMHCWYYEYDKDIEFLPGYPLPPTYTMQEWEGARRNLESLVSKAYRELRKADAAVADAHAKRDQAVAALLHAQDEYAQHFERMPDQQLPPT